MNEWVRLAAFGSLLGRREGSSNRRVEMRTAIESHARETKLENRSTQATLNLCADGVESRASSGSIYLALTYFSPYNLMWTMRTKTARHLATFSLASQPSRRKTPDRRTFIQQGISRRVRKA